MRGEGDDVFVICIVLPATFAPFAFSGPRKEV